MCLSVRLTEQNVCKYKVLPLLTSALEFGTGMSAFSAILTSVLKIGAMLSTEEYAATIVPSVVKLFSSNERAVRVHLLQVALSLNVRVNHCFLLAWLLTQNLSGYASSLTNDLVNEKIFPHVITGFADSAPILRELTVKSLVHFVPKLSPKTVEQQVLHYMAKLQKEDPEPAIRTNTTYCLAKIAQYLTPGTRDKILVPGFSTLR